MDQSSIALEYSISQGKRSLMNLAINSNWTIQTQGFILKLGICLINVIGILKISIIREKNNINKLELHNKLTKIPVSSEDTVDFDITLEENISESCNNINRSYL